MVLPAADCCAAFAHATFHRSLSLHLFLSKNDLCEGCFPRTAMMTMTRLAKPWCTSIITMAQKGTTEPTAAASCTEWPTVATLPAPFPGSSRNNMKQPHSHQFAAAKVILYGRHGCATCKWASLLASARFRLDSHERNTHGTTSAEISMIPGKCEADYRTKKLNRKPIVPSEQDSHRRKKAVHFTAPSPGQSKNCGLIAQFAHV